jgi:hypothetical protein
MGCSEKVVMIEFLFTDGTFKPNAKTVKSILVDTDKKTLVIETLNGKFEGKFLSKGD